MKDGKIDIRDFHWMMDMLQSIDVGLVVIDDDYRIVVWNTFMQNHSGLRADLTRDRSLFELFPEIPERWFRHKAESVFLLKNRAFTTWEQRPYLFRFKNYRPITGTEEFMYQNATINPLISADGRVEHLCIILYDVTDIATHKKGLEAANAELARLSRTDRLTELLNRGFWEECLVREFARDSRSGIRSSLVMFDIDHFKLINDSHGHSVGDEVIRTVAKVLRRNLRAADIAGRYGGEEFAVILMDTPADCALYFAERLRKGIEQSSVACEGRTVRFTVSLGVAESGPGADHKQWIDRADQAMYASKRGGRNRTTVFEVAMGS